MSKDLPTVMLVLGLVGALLGGLAMSIFAYTHQESAVVLGVQAGSSLVSVAVEDDTVQTSGEPNPSFEEAMDPASGPMFTLMGDFEPASRPVSRGEKSAAAHEGPAHGLVSCL